MARRADLVVLSFAVFILGANGRLGRLEGVLLFAAGVAYTGYTIQASRREDDEDEDDRRGPPVGRSAACSWSPSGWLLLVLGAHWMVDAASEFARALGVSDLVVGLTVVAVGTSLPEAAASVVAAIRGQRDMAVGNIIGSNIFNIVNVLGLTALLAPAGSRCPGPRCASTSP